MKALLVMLRYVSRAELAARPLRCLLMAGTVAVGVALLVAMHVATESIVNGFADDLERLGGRADLQVTFGTGETGFAEDLAVEVAGLPFVEQAAALVRGQVTFEDGERETVELFGLDLLQADVLDLYEVEVLAREKDDFTILNDPRGIFVTDRIAGERGLEVGSTVRLSAVDGVHRYTVRGVVATRGLAEFLGGRLVAMYLPAAQPVAGRDGRLGVSMVDQVDVRLNAGVGVAEARDAIEATLEPGFRVSTPIQRRMIGRHTVEGLRATLVGMSSLALLAAVFIIYASTTTLVLQRIPSMATLMTIGAGPEALVGSVVLEAALLGAAGSVVGVGLGLLLSSFVGTDAAAGMGLNYSLPFGSDRLSWDPWTVFVLHPFLGIATAAASAYFPARRLRWTMPIALQHEEESGLERSSMSTSGTIMVALVPTGLAVALLWYGVRVGDSDLVSGGGVLLVGGAVLAMLPVLQAFWKMSAPWLSRLFGVPGRIAAENLARSIDRSLVTASAITLSVAIAVGAGSLVQSFRSSVAGWYGFAGDALVSSRSVTGGWLAAAIGSDLETSLKGLPAVAEVDTLRVLQGQLYHGERIALVGLSSGLLEEMITRGALLDGWNRQQAALALSRGEAAAISENFLVHFGVPAPETGLTLASTTGEVVLPVAVVVPDYVSDRGTVLIGRELMKGRWKDDDVNYYSVRLRDHASVDALSRQTDRLLSGETHLVVTSSRRMMEKVDGVIAQAFADIDTIKLLVLFLTAVGVSDLVISNVFWRRRELAVLRLVGLTEDQVVRTAGIESVVVAVGAAVGGVVVGLICAWVWVNYNYPVLVGYVLELRLSWSSTLLSLGVAGGASMAAAVAAARYALRQPALASVRFDY